MSRPSLYRVTIAHSRHQPLRHRFRYPHTMWLADVDEVAAYPKRVSAIARFEARDHVGEPHASIRENIEKLLATAGIAPPHSVLMLAGPRSWGHAFNPLSVFWCLDADGSISAVVAEVHNTYGGRHVYLLPPSVTEPAGETVSKEFYVSPFFPVDGTYHMHLPAPGERVNLAITLKRDGRIAFAATMTGEQIPWTPLAGLLAAVRHSPLRVSALIRRQGIHLYLRGLPVTDRRPGHTREAAR